MRLVAARLTRVEGAAGARNARARWDRRGGLLLELVDDAGLVGLGEASPLPGYSPDDIDGCDRALCDVHERLREVPSEPDDAAAAVEAALAPLTATLDAVPAARFALETALLDLLGQRSGRSIAALLAAPAMPLTIVARSGLAGTASDPELLRSTARLLARGLRVVKVKLGGPGAFERELRGLERLRSELGGAFVLRLDANGGFPLSEARERLAQLAPLAPMWIEEPCAGEELLRLGRAPIGWAADESLQHRALVAPLLDAPGCAAIIVKPAIVGGLLAARKLALAALARGHEVVVTHLFDGPVALAAVAELALSLPGVAPCGLDDHGGLDAFPDVEIPQAPRGAAEIVASGRPGLGISIAAMRHVHP